MPYCKKCGTQLPPEAKFCPHCGAPVAVQPAPAPPARPIAEGLKQATWGERFVAWLIDIVILNVALIVFSAAVYSGHPFVLLRGEGWPALVFNFNASGLLFFGYWTLMESCYGRSVGKIVMRLKNTQLTGKQPTMAQAALESLGKAFFLPIDFLVGWRLYLRRKQRIFNYLSQTVVIRE